MSSYSPQHQFFPRPLPSYHLKAPKGWMNDPCGVAFDTKTGIYHLFYQWNPKSCDWGDISWGHFTSFDGIKWTHNGSEPVLAPGKSYDKDGIFTGCLYPTGPQGQEDELTIIYTSVCSLPINWALPHTRNSEGVSLAVSHDDGYKWHKYKGNPILPGEPNDDVMVTGFRDPYLAKWPAMDELRGEQSLYGIISGGISGKGPTVFMYAVAPEDLTRWEYLGPLVDLRPGFTAPGPWGGNFGQNWECVNFMTLRNEKWTQDFLLLGSEGGLRPGCKEGDKDAHGILPLWMAGQLRRTHSGVRMEYIFGGFLDHGSFYAANSYEHPVSGNRIVWGWLKEQDLPLVRRQAKGWSGYQSLPRELFLLSMENIIETYSTPLEEISSLCVTETSSRGHKTVQTLGIRPLPGLDVLRRGSPLLWQNNGGKGDRFTLTTTNSLHWELGAIINTHPRQRRVGFHVRQSTNSTQEISIYFSLENETIVVDRQKSNNEGDIVKDDVIGPFTLFFFDNKGVATTEQLHLRIFSDGDVFEVFANDRFALSTVVYFSTPTSHTISAFVEDEGSEVDTFETIKLWAMDATNLAK